MLDSELPARVGKYSRRATLPHGVIDDNLAVWSETRGVDGSAAEREPMKDRTRSPGQSFVPSSKNAPAAPAMGAPPGQKAASRVGGATLNGE